MSRPFRKSAIYSARRPSAAPSTTSEGDESADGEAAVRRPKLSHTQLAPEVAGCCGICSRWKAVRRELSTERAAYLMVNRRVGQFFGWQVFFGFLTLFTGIAAEQEFNTSSRWTTTYFGTELKKIIWVNFVFHWGCGLVGGLLWWRRLVLKGYLLFIYYLASLLQFLILLWTAMVAFKSMDLVFDTSENFSDQRPMFSWLAIMLIADLVGTLVFLIALVRYWRAMENEAFTPAKPKAEGGRMAADVLAAHAQATAPAAEADPTPFYHVHSSPTRKGRSRPPGTKRNEGIAAAPPPPVPNLYGDKAAAAAAAADEAEEEAAPQDRYVIDVEEPVEEPQQYRSSPSKQGLPPSPPKAGDSATFATPAHMPMQQFSEKMYEQTPASAPATLPPIASPAVQSLTPQQFEASWMTMEESGSFECSVSEIPEKHALLAHLDSRGFRVVATGVVEGNLKVYFYATGATMIACGLGSQNLKPATVFLAEFLFVSDTKRLCAKFKCSDEAATGTFVRRFRLQNLFMVTADPAAV